MNMRQHRLSIHLLAAVATVIAIVVSGRTTPSAASQAPTAALTAQRVARGAYLVKAAACNDCHTPWKMGDNGPEPDMTLMLSGHPGGLHQIPPPAMALPWVISASATNTAWASALGVGFAANLTPHPTGLGGWTEQQFVFALRTGRHKGIGRTILPPMPVEPLRKMTDEDLVSMFSYLRSIPAIENAVPDAILPTGPTGAGAPFDPASLRAPVAPGNSPVARGKYLVDVIGCTDCHTPTRLGDKGPEPDTSRFMAGYPASERVPAARPAQGPWVMHMSTTQAASGPWGISFGANITPDEETGIGAWTEQQFIDTLRTGRHQGRGRQLLPPMPWPAFGQMEDADLKAIFAYLKTVPKVRNKVPDPVMP
jgi:mono/diheme cytochrome c family protein